MELKNKLEKYFSVSGMPGLYELVLNRQNGLILKNPEDGKTRFYSMRKHQFSPLATIAIYTEDDSIELAKVFQNMLDQELDNPPPQHPVAAAQYFEYFEDVLPQYDKDQVHLSDIKKLIKWFYLLKKYSVLQNNDEEE